MDVATSTIRQTINLDDVRSAHHILHAHSGPTELRVKTENGALSGVFDNDEKLFEWIALADDPSVSACWWSIQTFNGVPVHNDLQYRSATGNKDASCRRFILVDIDPVRAIDPLTEKPFAAASESELAATRAKQVELDQWLRPHGITPFMTVISGNGYQMYIRLNDWPNGDLSNSLAKAFLQMLASKFSDGAAVVDTAVARIGGLSRIPGTVNRKGENTEERPWRVAEIVETNADVKGLSPDFVRQLVEDEGCEVEQPIAKRQFAGMHPDFEPETFAEWLGTSVVGEHLGSDGRLYYHLSPCPNVENDHRGASSKCCLVVGDTGIGFSCFSDDCEDVTLGDLMRKASEGNGPYTEPLFNETDPEDVLPVEDIGPRPVPDGQRIVTPEELFAEGPCIPCGVATKSSGTIVCAHEPPFSVDDSEDDSHLFKPESDPTELTDVGNGARLAVLYGNSIRKCKDDGKWYIWNRRRWRVDETSHIFKLAKETVRSILKEALDCETEGKRDSLLKWYALSSAKARLEAMVWSAQSEGQISLRSDTFDQNHSLLNVANGTLDLETMTLRKHRRSNMITKIIPITLDPQAKYPLWEKFLDDIMLGNKDNIEFLQRYAGYSLTGDTSEQCFVILYGTGSNGKGTLVNTFRSILGDYAQQASFDSFSVTRNEKSIRNDLAGLVGKRMVSASESEAGVRLSEALIKQLTGGDPITVRFLHQEFFEYLPTYKIWLSTNYKPRILGSDHGIWRRVRLIPFNAKFDGSSKDKHMADKLMAEAPGILNWMLEGYKKWKHDGLLVPKDIEDATSSYRSEQDSIAQFVEAKCEVGAGCRVSRSTLYEAYVSWAKSAGEHPMSNRSFVSALKERGYEESNTSKERGWKRLRLAESMQDDDEELE